MYLQPHTHTCTRACAHANTCAHMHTHRHLYTHVHHTYTHTCIHHREVESGEREEVLSKTNVLWSSLTIHKKTLLYPATELGDACYSNHFAC